MYLSQLKLPIDCYFCIIYFRVVFAVGGVIHGCRDAGRGAAIHVLINVASFLFGQFFSRGFLSSARLQNRNGLASRDDHVVLFVIRTWGKKAMIG